MTRNEKSNKNIIAGSSHRSEIPGILAIEDGFYFSTHNLPLSDHFFMATDFQIVVEPELFCILFGQKSSFSNNGKYKLAIEVSMPIDSAVIFLFHNIWKTPRIGDKEKPFIDILNEISMNRPKNVFEKSLEIPEDPNCYRKFPSNFATSSISSGQGMIEFFEASPEIMVSLIHNRPLRPNSGIKNILSVLVTPSLLYEFFITSEKVLKPIWESMGLNDRSSKL